MTARERKRLDATIALPLARFRTALKRLTLDELAALEARIEVLTIKNRWALGGHGLDRHRAPNELGLLARRLAETRRHRRARQSVGTQLHLVETAPPVPEFPALETTERAA